MYKLFLNSKYHHAPNQIHSIPLEAYLELANLSDDFSDTLYSFKKKLRGRSPQANYNDRATAVCRRS
jgi:hypothetical protein